MLQKEPIFKDKHVQSDFERNGFVKIDLLDSLQVQQLVACYEKNRMAHEATATLHHTTTDTQNEAIILEVDHLIKNIFTAALDQHMQHYDALVGCFHIKEKGAGSATGIHQDPTFVDENHFMSANVWVALHDINSSNGNLYFVKGSHRVSDALRPTPDCPVFFQSYSDSLKKQAVEVPLKAGQAVVFSNATIHGATDNQSNARRLAATLLVCNKGAQWQIIYNDSSKADKPIERYHLDLNTFIHMPKNGKPVAAALKETMNYTFPEISQKEFNARAGTESFSAHRIFSWLSEWLNASKK